MSEIKKENVPTILELQDICYSYHTLSGEIQAINHISLKITQGEFVALIGPSGCGKSTLLSLISGLLTPEEGTLMFPNKSHNSSEWNSSFQIGYMLQQDQLFEWLTIYENVTLALRIKKCKEKKYYERVDYLLEEYGLFSFRNKYPHELSGGMRQRAALIRTLAPNPDLLLLDEPFGALDYQTRLDVSSDICHFIRKENKTALLITHDISEALHLADRIIILSHRPSSILLDFPIHLSQNDNLTFSSSPEYANYFQIIWEALQNNEKKST